MTDVSVTKWRKCSKCGKRRETARHFKPAGARVCGLCKRKTSKATARDLRLRKTYGITSDEYDLILAAQGGVCAGCGQKRRYLLHVDHDHKVERLLLSEGKAPEVAARASIRGLLCARDNKVLRDTRDNVSNLQMLAEYLQHPPAREVLA